MSKIIKGSEGMCALTVAFVSIGNVLPQLLFVQGMQLAGHMTGLCCGFL